MKENAKLNLKNDIIFQAFFAKKGNEIFLIDFLEALLKTKIDKIKIKEEVNVEKLSKYEKGGRIDIQATLNDGIIANIEMQRTYQKGFEIRTVFYASKEIARNTKVGTNYEDMNKTIMINILGENMFPKEFKDRIADPNTKIMVILDTENGHDEITGWGHEDLTLTHPTDIVCRTSDYTCPRTLMIKSDKAARDLDLNLIEDLKNEKEMDVTIKLI